MSRKRHLSFETLESRQLLAAIPFATLVPDGYGKTLATASPITLTATGSGSVSGTIAQAFAADFFKIVAPAAGTMTIRQTAAPRSPLDSYLTVYDSTKTVIAAQNDDGPGTLNSRVAVAVTAGGTYYVKAAGFRTSTGGFILTFATAVADDMGNTLDTAASDSNALLAMDTNGGGRRSLSIEYVGDVDAMRFQTTTPGHIVITQTAAEDSGLDPVMEVYDASRKLIGRSDNFGTSKNSRYEFDTSAGGLFYVRAAGVASTLGQYTIDIKATPVKIDDFTNSFGGTTTIRVGTTSGYGIQTGTIERAGDIDVFKVIAPMDGRMTVYETANPGSLLSPKLNVYDATFQRLGVEDAAGKAKATVDVTVVTGETYYIEAGGSGVSAGPYTIQITTYSTPPPVNDTFDITLEITGATAAQTAIIEQAALRWESIITADIPAVYVNRNWIDDVLVEISIAWIDGANGTLAVSSQPNTRALGTGNGAGLPYFNTITLDAADVDTLVADGSLLATVMHEMGHSLGIGTVGAWTNLLTGGATTDPRFTGANASREYQVLFPADATAGVPVEALDLSHWRESLLGSELLTPYLNPPDTVNIGSPCSTITIGSLQDLGYQVDYTKADVYVAPPATPLKALLAAAPALVRGVRLQSAPALAPVTAIEPVAADSVLKDQETAALDETLALPNASGNRQAPTDELSPQDGSGALQPLNVPKAFVAKAPRHRSLLKPAVDAALAAYDFRS